MQNLNDHLSLQARAMQDPEIQNILTDPIMQQVTSDTFVYVTIILVCASLVAI